MNAARRTAFTLVELLVVIAISGTLIALLLPAVQAARESARRTQCTNNLKQMMVAEQLYHDSFGRYTMGRETHWQQGVSWAFHMLPFMEMGNVYESFEKSLPVFDDQNALAMRTPVPVFYCPSRRGPAADRDFDNNDKPSVKQDVAAGGDYAANAGLKLRFGTIESDWTDTPDISAVVGPIFTFSKIKARQVTDGMSSTLAIGERHIPIDVESNPGLEDHDKGDNAFFAADNPSTILAGTEHGLATGRYDMRNSVFGSEHSQLVQFAFLDGHVLAINRSIDRLTLQRLSIIADGEVVDTSNL
jgi:prepilin-type N-terminal cleavage/methylation domain-containing protein/prepilin-type processing-associated H-X9-DG protein